MPNKDYSEVSPERGKESQTRKEAKMAKNGSKKQTQDGRERGVEQSAKADFKSLKYPNENVPSLGHQKGAE